MKAGSVATPVLLAGTLALLGGVTLMAADTIPREPAPLRLDLEGENWRHPPECPARRFPGGYVVQAVYDTTRDPDPSLWHGRVDAFCYAFAIHAPAGDAERAAVLAGQASTLVTRNPQAALVMLDRALRFAPEDADIWYEL